MKNIPLLKDKIRECIREFEAIGKLPDSFEQSFSLAYPTWESRVAEELRDSAGFVNVFFRGLLDIELAWIKHNSQSPIELMFCAGVLLISRLKYFNLLRFSPPDNLAVIKRRQILQEQIRSAKELKQKIIGELGISWFEATKIFRELTENGKLHRDIVDDVMALLTVYDTMGYQNAYHVTQQAWLPSSIKVNGNKVRVDLYIWLPFDEKFNLIVECDGYRYHSDRTSFTKDRKRIRALMMHGYQVLPFSGLEIYEDPLQAALELVNYLEQKHQSVLARTDIYSQV